VNYTEGARVGYKWFESEHKQTLFPFGFGLSYTSYAYSGLQIDEQQRTVSFTVKNTGKRTGTEIAQVYVELPGAAEEPFKRLVGWQRLTLTPGESKQAIVPLNTLYLSIFNTGTDKWDLLKGEYKILVGASSEATSLTGVLHIN